MAQLTYAEQVFADALTAVGKKSPGCVAGPRNKLEPFTPQFVIQQDGAGGALLSGPCAVDGQEIIFVAFDMSKPNSKGKSAMKGYLFGQFFMTTGSPVGTYNGDQPVPGAGSPEPEGFSDRASGPPPIVTPPGMVCVSVTIGMTGSVNGAGVPTVQYSETATFAPVYTSTQVTTTGPDGVPVTTTVQNVNTTDPNACDLSAAAQLATGLALQQAADTAAAAPGVVAAAVAYVASLLTPSSTSTDPVTGVVTTTTFSPDMTTITQTDPTTGTQTTTMTIDGVTTTTSTPGTPTLITPPNGDAGVTVTNAVTGSITTEETDPLTGAITASVADASTGTTITATTDPTTGATTLIDTTTDPDAAAVSTTTTPDDGAVVQTAGDNSSDAVVQVADSTPTTTDPATGGTTTGDDDSSTGDDDSTTGGDDSSSTGDDSSTSSCPGCSVARHQPTSIHSGGVAVLHIE